MSAPVEIRDLPAKDRPLARRIRVWYIRTLARRGGHFLTVRNPSPGHPLTIAADVVRVGRQRGSAIARRRNRAEIRKTGGKSRYDAEVKANMLRKGVRS